MVVVQITNKKGLFRGDVPLKVALAGTIYNNITYTFKDDCRCGLGIEDILMYSKKQGDDIK